MFRRGSVGFTDDFPNHFKEILLLRWGHCTMPPAYASARNICPLSKLLLENVANIIFYHKLFCHKLLKVVKFQVIMAS